MVELLRPEHAGEGGALHAVILGACGVRVECGVKAVGLPQTFFERRIEHRGDHVVEQRLFRQP